MEPASNSVIVWFKCSATCIDCSKLAHHLAKADGGIESVPDRKIVVVADSSFAALDLIAAIRRHVCLVTRLRLDANIFAPALGHPAEGQQRLS